MSGFKLPDIGTVDSLGVLSALLPGLLTVVIVRALSARGRKLEVVEVILHALAYTLLINAMWDLLTRAGSWIPTADVVGLSLCAIALGVVVAKSTNSGVIYDGLRRLGLTNEASWATIWETAFREFRNSVGEYVVLHLKDGRRVYGAIRGFSAQQRDGHVCLERARWLGDGLPEDEQAGIMVFNAEDVGVAEFVPHVRSHTNGRREADSRAAAETIAPAHPARDREGVLVRATNDGSAPATPAAPASTSAGTEKVI